MWLRVLLPLLVGLAAFSAFLPALNAEFVNWDDDKNIINNPYYRGLSGKHLDWMFTTTKMGHWQPLSWITLAIDYTIHGEDNPGGYHLTNMLLHAAGAVAFYFLALRLLTLAVLPTPGESGVKMRLAAAFAALVFAIHPLRVEAVAWVTERRDVLSGLFFIATINAYLISRTAPRFRLTWYVASILLLGLSVLSKAWGMTMPAILLVLDWYPLRRLGRQEKGSGALAPPSESRRPDRNAKLRGHPTNERLLTPFLVLAEKLPFAIIAVAVAIKAKAAQAGQLETLKSLEEHGVVERIAQALYGLAFYVYKTLIPIKLIPIYEIPQDMNPLAPRFVISAIAVIAAAVLLIRFRRRWPAGLALAACYVAIFSPVSGVAQSGPQLVKDSYTYLCCLSWAVLAGGLLLWVGRRWGAKAFQAGVAAAAAILVLLGMLTWRQTGHWENSRSLWEHTLAVDSQCWNAHNNMAILLKQEGKLQQAADHYARSLAVNPRNADALFNRGNCLKAMKDYEGAIASYLEAIATGPDPGPAADAARLNLANTYRELGQLDKSIPLHEHIARKRGDPQLYLVLGDDYLKLGESGKAEQYYRLSLSKRPNSAPARTGLARVMLGRSDCREAMNELQQALADQPNYAPARQWLESARSQCP